MMAGGERRQSEGSSVSSSALPSPSHLSDGGRELNVCKGLERTQWRGGIIMAVRSGGGASQEDRKAGHVHSHFLSGDCSPPRQVGGQGPLLSSGAGAGFGGMREIEKV